MERTLSRMLTGDGQPWTSPITTALLFCLALAPFSATYLFYHPDERHYTDAACQMVQTGDFLTPRDPDGTPRFLKPGLCYWILAGSYALFGISPIASRFPFLLCGGAVVWLASYIARYLFHDDRTSRVTALMMATHPTLFIASVTSLTDIVQITAILIATLGWLKLLRNADHPTTWWWIALGTGTAIATKGTPGLLLSGFSSLYMMYNPWRPVRLQWRRAWLPITLGIIIAGGWYLAMLGYHGQTAWNAFFEDQVHSRLPRSPWRPFWQLPATILSLWLLSLPWSWYPLQQFRSCRRKWWDRLTQEQRAQVGFLCGWPAFLTIPLSVVDPFSLRYFLLVTPFLVILCAWGWCQLPEELLRPTLVKCYRLLKWTFVVVSAVAGGAIAITFSDQPYAWSFMGLFSGTCLMLFLFGRQFRRNTNSCVQLAVITTVFGLALFPVAYLIIAPFALPDQGAQIAQSLLRTLPPNGSADVWLFGKPAMASKIRLYTRGKFPIHVAEMHEIAHVPGGEQTWIVALKEDFQSLEEPDELLQSTASLGFRDLKWFPLIKSIGRGRLQQYLASRRETFVLAGRRHGLPIALAKQAETERISRSSLRASSAPESHPGP